MAHLREAFAGVKAFDPQQVVEFHYAPQAEERDMLWIDPIHAISGHANSGGHQAGYLSTSGTSTYYKWSFSRDFAAAIHARLLEFTHLPDFGNVGNFNYHPLRANTWMPAMLVEQAFMSNPADEAKLLDPAFRKHMMQAVVQGTEDWLKSVRR